MRNKFHSVVHTIQSHKYDIFGLTETFVKTGQSLLSIPNYTIYRNDIDKKGKRGVAIIISDKLKVEPFSLNSNISDNIEILSIKIQAGFSKSIIIVCVYRHPKYDIHKVPIEGFQ